MEFFKIVDVESSESLLKDRLTIENLDKFCKNMFPLDEGIEVCKIGSIWGEFTLRRDEIMGGVRFSMLNCPNALTWTITTGYPPDREKIVIHTTINRERKPDEFIEEIHQFIDDLNVGLKSFMIK